MKAEEINLKNIIQRTVSNNIIHSDGVFWINYDPILTEDQFVYPLDIYILLDFLSSWDLRIRSVKFYHAFLKGFYLTIVVLDVNTGELLHRKLRINDDNPTCSWLLIESNYLVPDDESDDEKVIRSYCNRK
jgi:hypothetical protein